MTNMYRTILLVLPALLLLAACADDVTPPAEPADTLAGQPVRFTATGLTVTPAGVTQTKVDGTETDFPAEGSTITVYMTGNGGTQQANYTYSTANGWTSTAPLLWPDTQHEYTFTAISPADTDTEITLPTAWTADNIAAEEYNDLRTTYGEHKTKAKSSLSLTLRHALVKVQVVSISGQQVYLTDAPTMGTLNLTGGCEDITKGTVTLYTADDMIYEGYVLPSASEFGLLADNVYTVDTKLEAGTVVTTYDKTEALITCPEPGKLKDVWPEGNPQKVVITGTLNDDDLKTIKNHKGEIVNLYVMGGKTEDADWNTLNMGHEATRLESVYLAEATFIGDNAFSNCSALKSISLPKATNIGTSAFNGCTQLTSVNLPKAESIGETAFLRCSGLTTVSLPQAKYIESSAFTSCTQLTTVTLPKAESIGGNAFPGCNQLSSICLSTGAKIDNTAFTANPKLRTLFLSDYYPETEFDEETYEEYGNHGWTTIYYGYTGGDYLDEKNYTGHWTNTTN